MNVTEEPGKVFDTGRIKHRGGEKKFSPKFNLKNLYREALLFSPAIAEIERINKPSH